MKFHFPILQVTVRAMGRRIWSNIALLLITLLGVSFALILLSLIGREERARDEMMKTTEIKCVVTDAKGMNSKDLGMLSSFVDKLIGRDSSDDLSQYVCSVNALSSMQLISPENYELRRILSFASDEELFYSVDNITFFDSWNEEVFRTNNAVCIVPYDSIYKDEKTVTVLEYGEKEIELLVIGTFFGSKNNVIYSPFYFENKDVVHSVFSVNSCSFVIRDNEKLSESKNKIHESFVVPSSFQKNDGMTFGVIVQDQIFLDTLERINGNLKMLNVVLPMLFIILFLIGVFSSFLTVKGRRREFAIMRCLGMSRSQVFFTVFSEFLLLSFVGGVCGVSVVLLFEKGFPNGAGAAVLSAIGVYLFGSAMAVIEACNVNTVRAMKEEGE